MNFTCQSNGSNIVLLWSFLSSNDIVQGFNVQAIPDSTDCSALNYSNVTSNSLTIFNTSKYNICGYTTFTVRAVNCLGEGQADICAIEQG